MRDELPTIFNSPDRVESNFYDVDGYRTHVWEAGAPSGSHLVLVHGAAGQIGMGADRWYPNIIPLSETFRVHAIDELGHGDTDAPLDRSLLAMVRERADHVAAFIEQLDVGPVHLVGQSQGGWIAGYIAIQRPELVERLILVDSASMAGASLGGDRGNPDYFKRVFKPGTMIPKFDLTTRDGIRSQIAPFMFDPSMIIDPWLDRLERLSKRWNEMYMTMIEEFWSDAEHARARIQAMYSIDGTHISELAHTISRPTLVLWGKQSNKDLEHGLELYKKIPRAQMHILDEANHFLWLDQPHVFNALVRWYLTEKDIG
ncbi:alpha/beta fold hydrolase [Desertimonas flava]|uniref:alpha/beta fold hydrolase n=1 Tax=Desertimonas flava TaxID=2064846 RepID=UPI000E345C3B|nr:alpha/beta hydrolase [Desertimonas flava]